MPKKDELQTSTERLGIEEGLQRGRQEGLEKDIRLNVIAIAKKLIAQGRSIHIYKT